MSRVSDCQVFGTLSVREGLVGLGGTFHPKDEGPVSVRLSTLCRVPACTLLSTPDGA